MPEWKIIRECVFPPEKIYKNKRLPPEKIGVYKRVPKNSAKKQKGSTKSDKNFVENVLNL